MKDFFVGWTVRGGIVLVIALCTLCGGAESAWASNKTALVVVGFTGAPPPGFQNVLLNVQAVRINPHANAGPGTRGWQIIPTPPGIGGGNQKAELQIDLNTSQDVPVLFNTSKVRPGDYKIAEILLDPNNPGTLIPNCPQTPGGPEGCINYPIALTNGQVITAPISGVSPSNSTLATLVLQAQLLMIGPAPTVAGGAYQATLVLSQSAAALGAVVGTVNTSGSSTGATGKLVKLAVTAETIGTNTAITTTNVQTSKCPNKSASNCYTVILPAAPNFGTLYDLAVAGGGDSYSATRLPPVFPNTSNTPLNGPTFNVAGQALGNISGTVKSGCVPQSPIAGATLQLLIPPGDQSSNNATIDCTMTPEQCIAVASANTDNAGDFPLPGSLTVPPQFQNVPAPPSKAGSYAMEVTAPGFDPLFVKVKPSVGAGKSGGGTCEVQNQVPPATKFTKCDLSLTTAFITGTVPINTPFPGETASVQVFAEPTGTNNIQSSLPMPKVVKNPNTSTTYTINVPSIDPAMPDGAIYDLFATTVNDKFQGVSDPYQGHSIVVRSGVKIPASVPLPAPAACSTTTANFDPSFPIDCVGHGSVLGTVGNANLGASIVLSKLDPIGNPVQITTSPILNQSSVSPTSNYAFCTPGDTYELQALQLPQPVPDEIPGVVPTPALTGDSVTVTIPQAPLVNASTTPTASPTPSGSPTATPSAMATFKITCPTTCSNTNPRGSCPGVCMTVNQAIPNLPPPPTIPAASPTPAAATP